MDWIVTLHCIIYQDHYVAKILQITDVMKSVVSKVNYRWQQISETQEIHIIPWRTECWIQWNTSALKYQVDECWEDSSTFLLKRNTFLSWKREDSNTDEYQNQLQDTNFLCSLAFLADLTGHMNVLNLNVQGKQHANWTANGRMGHS